MPEGAGLINIGLIIKNKNIAIIEIVKGINVADLVFLNIIENPIVKVQ